jgi:predicted secreted protein
MALYAGRLVLVKLDTNNVGGSGASWTTIGNQRGGSMKRGAETADSTHKSDAGWPSAVITRTPWSVSCDGALDAADTALAQLKTAWAAKTKQWVQIDYTSVGGIKEEGQAIITDFSLDFPEGDLCSYTLELQGDGPLAASP